MSRRGSPLAGFQVITGGRFWVFTEVKLSVEVTASTLYEAVALGLAAIREQGRAGEIPEGLNTVDASVTDMPVTREDAGFQQVVEPKG